MDRLANQLTRAQRRQHLVWFSLGLAAALIAFIPSPALLGPNYRYTANIGQFVLVAEVAPPLLFLGLPGVMTHSLLRWDGLVPRWLTAPITVGLVSCAVFLGWHLPLFFETASHELIVWILKELTLFAAGLLAWWPIIGPLSQWQVRSYPLKLVYLFFLRIPFAVLGGVSIFAERLIYTSRSLVTAICTPASLADQQTAGVILWTVGGLIILTAFSIIFFRWFGALTAEAPREFW